MESVQMRSFFWSVFSRIWTKYRDLWSKYGPEKTPYLDTFHTVSKVYKKMLKNTLLLRQEKKFVMELDFRSVTKKRLKKIHGSFIYGKTRFLENFEHFTVK